MGKGQRLDKFLAHMGFGTRREVKTLLRQRRVVLNGQRVTAGELKIDPERDQVKVDDRNVKYQEFYYLMLNKPAGYLSATKDRFAPTVLDLIPADLRVRDLSPVGRLDKDTEGLLLLTNDGPLAHRLLAPNSRVPKTYFLRVDGKVTPAEQAVLAAGVLLDDGYRTLPAEVHILTSGEVSELLLTIYEGKFHQVKRMLHAVGKEVIYLQRRSMGNLTLDPGLASGECRPLTEEEIKCLKAWTRPVR
ncbi:MAG TPA: rRNA pseudouridine synthase [Firmicutes bacterium]|jgi:16S rRNA pseudouridine516 synthase|nr:rRNA pseudouridine synthase [Bacillota bacterium]